MTSAAHPHTWQAPIDRIGFVSGPREHTPIPGAVYDVLTLDGRAYTDLTYRAATDKRPASFYRAAFLIATSDEVFQYQLNALPTPISRPAETTTHQPLRR
ncbi:hypothetical protein [Fibrella forsythiae]|uniref:Uncharacterized protein n=1 Tax=Fibrella forsythiae TaxID=2817061 RepID=A0ABS3JAG1_9BACT|nr:hypothetical protein [Fibrella forsythiae]MBO0946977.1 hypothetical protein [Fibrella forsythiae]